MIKYQILMAHNNYQVKNGMSIWHPFSHIMQISRKGEILGFIRYHTRFYQRNVVSLDWVETGLHQHPFAFRYLYDQFERFARTKGYTKIEALCHAYSLRLFEKLGFRVDDCARSDIDPTLEAVVKEF